MEKTGRNTGENWDTEWIRTLAGGATDLANSSAVSDNGGGGDPGYPDDGRWTL